MTEASAVSPALSSNGAARHGGIGERRSIEALIVAARYMA
jgi:hypothetical protein